MFETREALWARWNECACGAHSAKAHPSLLVTQIELHKGELHGQAVQASHRLNRSPGLHKQQRPPGKPCSSVNSCAWSSEPGPKAAARGLRRSVCLIRLHPKESFLPTLIKYSFCSASLLPRAVTQTWITAAQLLYSLCYCTSLCLTLANDLPGNCSYQREPIRPVS